MKLICNFSRKRIKTVWFIELSFNQKFCARSQSPLCVNFTDLDIFAVDRSEAYLGPRQTDTMKLFAKIVGGF